MSNHYYDPNKGRVVKRPPANPEYKRGSNAGRKQRLKDTANGIYPRQGMPITSQGAVYDAAYQGSYYQRASLGRPMLGDSPRVTLSVTVDKTVANKLDALPVGRGECLALGSRLISSNLPERLLNAYQSEILGMIESDGMTTLITRHGQFEAATPFEALLLMLVD